MALNHIKFGSTYYCNVDEVVETGTNNDNKIQLHSVLITLLSAASLLYMEVD